MGFLSLALIGLLTFIFICYKIHQRRMRAKHSKNLPLPPGPRWSIPFIGHMWQLDPNKPYKTVTEWGEKYGPVVKAKFGQDDVVILYSFEAIKEAFVRQAEIFTGRPTFWLLNHLQHDGMRGIINTEGEKWREQRRFTLTRLRDFGMGRPEVLSSRVNSEVTVMLNSIDGYLKQSSDPIDIISEMRYCVANIICSICYGYSFPRGDPQFERFQTFLDKILKIVGLAGPLMYMPWIRHFVPGQLGLPKLEKYRDISQEFHVSQVEKHREMLKKDQNNKQDKIDDDLTTAYIKEIDKRNADEIPKPHYFTNKQLEFLLGDLFFAGQETTVTTLRWGLLFLMQNPKVQRNILSEIKEKLGRMPELKDRPSLPYLQAVVMEVQRLGNIVPFGVLHKNTQDTNLLGYFIPKGTTIIPNLWAIHMNDQYFNSPERFNPIRFLNPDGSLKTKVEGFAPFSMGKRICLGEFLARAELFAVIGALVWNYEISFDDTAKQPSSEPQLGTTLSTEYFKVCLTKRQHPPYHQ